MMTLADIRSLKYVRNPEPSACFYTILMMYDSTNPTQTERDCGTAMLWCT